MVSEADNAREGMLSPVSSADSKKSKSSIDRRVFERLSVSSVQHFVESLGYDTHFRKFFTIISSDALCVLTEDVNYRLREFAHKATIFMRQRRGQKLTAGDVNEALKWSGAEKLLGHRSREPPRLHFVKELNLFVPNEGVVDAPMLALSKRQPAVDFGSILTGHFLPSLVEVPKEAALELEQLKAIIIRLLKQLLSCSDREFGAYLRRFREACSIHPCCSSLLLGQIVPMVLQSPVNRRLWFCLRETILNSELSHKAADLRLICQIADFISGSILHKQNALSSMLSDLHYRLLASISEKYDFISSAMFDGALVQRTLGRSDFYLIPAAESSRILHALFYAVDLKLIFSNIDLIIDRFGQYAVGDLLTSELHFAWKLLIDGIIQHMLRNLSEENSSHVDNILSHLLGLSKEVFGNSSPMPLLDFPTPTMVKPTRVDGMEGALEFTKSACQLLEMYCNSIENKACGQACLTDEGKSAVVIIPRKRKRRREAADVFEFPKRLRLMHQRDIILVFHRTQATVRPLLSSRSSTDNGDRHRKSGPRDSRVEAFFAKVMKRKYFFRKRNRVPALVVDVCTVVL